MYTGMYITGKTLCNLGLGKP